MRKQSRSEDMKGLAVRMLMKFSQAVCAVPTSLYVRGLSLANTALPLGGGSYADVFLASLAGRAVAVKRPRAFIGQPEVLSKVRHAIPR